MNKLPRDSTPAQVDAYYKRQYLHGGFCGYCGEGTKPLLNNDIEAFGLCPFDGKFHEALPSGNGVEVATGPLPTTPTQAIQDTGGADGK